MVKLKKAILFFLGLTASAVSAQDKCEIYTDTVVVNAGDQYHMFFKAYSSKVKTYLESNERIAIDFETENPDAVTASLSFTSIRIKNTYFYFFILKHRTK